MKSTLLSTLFLMALTSLAFAQAGSIGVFADPQGMECNLRDRISGYSYYYLVHLKTGGATGCSFRAPKPACSTGDFLFDEEVFPMTSGTSQSGVWVGYDGCYTGTIHVLTMVFFTYGSSESCCYWPVLGRLPLHPILALDCFDQPMFPSGGQGIVQSRAKCNCNVPTEDTTWGRVKALYSE